jgi:hypothetical protein
MNSNITITCYDRSATFSRKDLLVAHCQNELRIAIVEMLAAQWGYKQVDTLSYTGQLETIFEDVEAQLNL